MAETSERQLLTRQLIIDAATNLIVTGGLRALSLRRLAGQLGVTAPALYAHVHDKQDILRTIAEAEFGLLVANFNAVDTPDPSERIRAHNRTYVAHSRERPELFNVMFLFAPQLPDADIADDVTLPASTAAFSTAAAAVGDAIACGMIVADDPLRVTLAIWASVHDLAVILQIHRGRGRAGLRRPGRSDPPGHPRRSRRRWPGNRRRARRAPADHSPGDRQTPRPHDRRRPRHPEPGERRRVRYRLRSAPVQLAQQFLAALAHQWDDRLDALQRHLTGT